MKRHCRRLPRHQPHEWIGTHATAWPVVYECPGVITTAGGEVDNETRARIAEEVAAERYEEWWEEGA